MGGLGGSFRMISVSQAMGRIRSKIHSETRVGSMEGGPKIIASRFSGKNPTPRAMARRIKTTLSDLDPPKLEISSLIDICFLLLIYFLATSTLIPRESDLQMRLPGPMPLREPQPVIRPLFIGIHADGGIYTGFDQSLQMLDPAGEGRALPLLSDHLALYATATRGANEEPLVQIYVDGEASQQRVIDVLNALAKVNIQGVTFTDLVGM